MGKHIKGFIILAVLATTGLFVPGIGAVFPGGHDAWPIVTAPDLNVSGIDMANSHNAGQVPDQPGTHPH